MKHEPLLRWSDHGAEGVPSGVREALRDASVDGPSAAQLERLVAGVIAPDARANSEIARLVIGGKNTTSLAMKLAVGVLSMLLVSGLALWAWPTTRSVPTAAPAQPSEGSRVAQSKALPRVNAPIAIPASRVAGPAPEVPVEPTEAHARKTKAKAALAPSAPNTHVRASRRGSADEIALLQRAKRALPAKPTRALALLEKHAHEFPQGSFTEEREALAIEAFFADGRGSQARAQLAAFRARYPHSAYRRRLDALATER